MPIRSAITGKLLGPLLIGVGAVMLSLSVALWVTSNRLDSARQSLAQARQDVSTCIVANTAAQVTIDDLERQQALNQAARDSALRAQQAAIRRADELQEQIDNAQTVQRVIVAADGDACAYAGISQRLRDTASRDGNPDGLR